MESVDPGDIRNHLRSRHSWTTLEMMDKDNNALMELHVRIEPHAHTHEPLVVPMPEPSAAVDPSADHVQIPYHADAHHLSEGQTIIKAFGPADGDADRLIKFDPPFVVPEDGFYRPIQADGAWTMEKVDEQPG